MSGAPLTWRAGGCHCGGVRFERALPAKAGRRHAAFVTSNPERCLDIQAMPGAVERYCFGTRPAEFLMCAECGCYVAEERSLKLMMFDGAAPETRVAGRKGRSTLAVLVEAQSNA